MSPVMSGGLSRCTVEGGAPTKGAVEGDDPPSSPVVSEPDEDHSAHIGNWTTRMTDLVSQRVDLIIQNIVDFIILLTTAGRVVEAVCVSQWTAALKVRARVASSGARGAPKRHVPRWCHDRVGAVAREHAIEARTSSETTRHSRGERRGRSHHRWRYLTLENRMMQARGSNAGADREGHQLHHSRTISN